MAPSNAGTAEIPLLYQSFFLYIEPVATAVGAYYSFFLQQTYLDLTHRASSPRTGIPTSTSIVLSQLANMYFVFALNEALVLRASKDFNVWRILLFCLLLADFGHLYSVRPLGLQIYYDVLNWNAIDWGNLGFVYVGATMRTCFLLGVGFPAKPSTRKSPRKRQIKSS